MGYGFGFLGGKLDKRKIALLSTCTAFAIVVIVAASLLLSGTIHEGTGRQAVGSSSQEEASSAKKADIAGGLRDSSSQVGSAASDQNESGSKYSQGSDGSVSNGVSSQGYSSDTADADFGYSGEGVSPESSSDGEGDGDSDSGSKTDEGSSAKDDKPVIVPDEKPDELPVIRL